jgi:chromosomal replication initiator protein
MTANYYIIPGIIRSKAISFERVLSIVSYYTGISQQDIIKKCRKREIIFARHLVCYFSRKFTNLALASIGEHFGGQDHTTVLNADRKIKGFLDIKDPQTCEAVETIENLLR